jgi:predicted DNA-binding ribbon-helix-helix protein
MPESIRVQRVQTGVRIEKRMLKVLKGLAEYLDMSLGDLLEGIVLHAFEGKGPFTQSTLARIEQLKTVYSMDYGAEASHRMIDDDEPA